jgi:ribulose-phosphate 3-epimerase
VSILGTKILVAPSILSSNFARLEEEVRAVEKAGADWLHVDVMDGHFVDNLTLGPPVIKSIKDIATIPLDVHLMIEKPELTVERYVKAGASNVTVHVEASLAPGETLSAIKKLGAKAGITLRPQTPIEEIEKYLPLVDLVLIMTVNPGWGGQAFMAEQLPKIEFVRKWASKNNPKLFIEVDGGINPETAKKCREAGADVFVAGNAIFRSGDYAKAIKEIRGVLRMQDGTGRTK